MSDRPSLAMARAAIAPLYRAPEPERLAALVPAATLTTAERAAVEASATVLLTDLRKAGSDGWVERFLQEYSLTTDEGVALLSLAEAYLRVPDPLTAAELVRDKLGRADWAAHAGQSGSVLVNSATLGLILARGLMDDDAGTLTKLVGRLGEPAILKAVAAAMQMMGEAFVLGRTIKEALKRADRGGSAAFRHSFDMLGEGARTTRLAEAAMARGIGLTLDAEEAERLEMSLDIIEAVARAPSLAGWEGLGMAVQAYQRRAPAVIAWADALGRETGRRLTVRLVKGAYWDSEIKRGQ
ncbi:MAG: proline dehydrogenase family protein, partial [Caulobacter sp.]|nr:proline dehydrogenase family protein [Caulobacter sp.]